MTKPVSASKWPVGLIVHTYKDGDLHYRGVVRKADGDILWVNAVDALCGWVTDDVLRIDTKTIEVRYFETAEASNHDYERWERQFDAKLKAERKRQLA